MQLCHNREKAVSKVTGKPYEYCGRECRDKAKNLLEKAIAGTCRTCLVCWSALGPNVNLPTCGERCHLLTEALAPVMIEIPRGHVLFDKCELYRSHLYYDLNIAQTTADFGTAGLMAMKKSGPYSTLITSFKMLEPGTPTHGTSACTFSHYSVKTSNAISPSTGAY